MKNKIIPIIFFLLFSFQLLAQQKSSKEIQGDKYSFSYSYSDAITAYSKAKDLTLDGKRKLAMAYHKMDNNQAADSVYSTYIINGTSLIPEDYIYYAMALKMNNKYAENLYWMDKFAQVKPTDLRAIDYLLNKNEYNNWSQDSKVFKIEMLNLNTNEIDFGPAYFKDKIVFTSSRNKKVFSKEDNWHNEPYLDLYMADIDKTQLINIVNFDKNINGKMHDGPATFSKTGTTMAFTRNNYHDKSKDRIVELQIFFSDYSDGKWSTPTPFAYNSIGYSVGHPCFNAAGNTMYFISDMPGGFGGSDIYKTTKDGFGIWSKPINLGNQINTEGDELFPFYEENSMMLFFTSDGHYGLGGLDIFLCEIRDDKIGKIINVGAPLNSRFDDISAIADDKMSTGYFSSNRPGGKGTDDMYSFSIQKIDKKIQGVVLQKNGTPIPKSFVKLYNDKDIAIDSIITKEDGAFIFKAANNSNFKLVGVKETFADGNAFATTLGTELIVKADIILTKIPIKEQIKAKADLAKILELNEIFFDLNKSTIREDAKVELDKIVAIMNEYPKMRVELSSFTDCRASEKYNQILSDSRAKASAKYIKSRITKPSRIFGKGYGEVKNSSDCPCENNAITDCTEVQYQEARKTVFTILRY
jgi:outer membrane protein OmpA-like peptidoglycan-associated protein